MRVRAGWRKRGAALCIAMLPGMAMTQPSASGEFVGFSGRRWSTDYGITQGRCDHARILLVTGDARRDLVAEHETHLRNRTVGVIGAPGSAILLSTRPLRSGAQPDQRDRACIGHLLELGSIDREVSWLNPATRTHFVATLADEPGPAGALRCRVLLLTALPSGRAPAAPAGRIRPERLIACQTGAGVWSLR